MKQIKDKFFKKFITPSELEKRVNELACEINNEFAEKNPLLIGVLNGSFIFLSDLFKKITIDCEVCFIRVASYQKTSSSGKVKEIIGLNEDISGRDIIIVEDIVDTGLTISEIKRQLGEKSPASLKIMTLLYKPDAIKTDVTLDYVGFEIENKFVVGYGLDYDGFGRNIDEILVLA